MKRSHGRERDDAQHSTFRGAPSTSVGEHGVGKRLAFVIDSLPQPCPRALDVGCGLGIYLEPLSAYSSEAVGIDINHEHLSERAKKPSEREIFLAQMDAQNLAFAQHTFDAVTMIEVLEHIPDAALAIEEVCRVLKPGGAIIMSVPSKLFVFETHPITIGGRMMGSPWGTGTPFLPLLPRVLRKRIATVRLYYPWELEKMLIDKGFAIRKIGFLSPSFDTLESKLPESLVGVCNWIRRISDWLEKSPLRIFGSTLMVHAEKVE